MNYMRYDVKFNYALKRNKRKNYKWSGISLLDQLHYIIRENAAGKALICTQEVTICKFPSLQLRRTRELCFPWYRLYLFII